jgi:Tfp pilus assembly protein PilV
MPTTSRPARRRTGITIIEVLVALVLLSIGILAVAGTSALSLRQVTAARLERDAIMRATNRAALLSAHGCDQPSSGAEEVASMRESWQLSPVSPGAATLDIRVDWSDRSRPRFIALASAVLC